jgi:hypothetical protein
MKHKNFLNTLKVLFLFIFISPSFAQQDFEDLDGVVISAMEEYPSVKKNELAVGFMYMPVDPYFHSMGLNTAYTRYLNKDWGWEVLNVSMVFGIEKSLLSALAEQGRKNGARGYQPQNEIEQTSYILASNIKYTLSYGKSIFFDKYIRLTRTELVTGLSSISTTLNNYMAVNLGVQVDFVVSEHFSWKFEVINYFNFQKEDADLFDYGTFRLLLAWRFE